MKKTLLALLIAAAGVLIVASVGAAGAANTKRVTIMHVQKGCHVWSAGTTRTASLRVSLKVGDKLTVLNQDVDMHKLVRVSGPWINTGAFMMTSQSATLRFAKVGLYRFHTRVADMRGMPEMETIGPDNGLVLTILVR
jgi:plastocyanin